MAHVDRYLLTHIDWNVIFDILYSDSFPAKWFNCPIIRGFLFYDRALALARHSQLGLLKTNRLICGFA